METVTKDLLDESFHPNKHPLQHRTQCRLHSFFPACDPLAVQESPHPGARLFCSWKNEFKEVDPKGLLVSGWLTIFCLLDADRRPDALREVIGEEEIQVFS